MLPELKQLNFRKLRHEFPSQTLKDGKTLLEKKGVSLQESSVEKGQELVVKAEVKGSWGEKHTCLLVINTQDTSLQDSSCDCPQKFECQHLACLVMFLEEHGTGSHAGSTEGAQEVASATQAKDIKRIREEAAECAKSFHLLRRLQNAVSLERPLQKGVLQISVHAASIVGQRVWELQFSVRLAHKNRVTLIQNPRQFLLSLVREEPIILGQERFILSPLSFEEGGAILIHALREEIHFVEKSDKSGKGAFIDDDGLGRLFAKCCELYQVGKSTLVEFYWETADIPLQFHSTPMSITLKPSVLQDPYPHLLVGVFCSAQDRSHAEEFQFSLDKVLLSKRSGVVFKGGFYQFSETLSKSFFFLLEALSGAILPKVLASPFIYQTLPELQKILHVDKDSLAAVVNVFPEEKQLLQPSLVVEISYNADEQLTADIGFKYDETLFPYSSRPLAQVYEKLFQGGMPVPARSSALEERLVENELKGWSIDEKELRFLIAKEQLLVDFLARHFLFPNQSVEIVLPSAIQSRFTTDTTLFSLQLLPAEKVTDVKVTLEVRGALEGTKVTDVKTAFKEGRDYLLFGKTAKSGVKSIESLEQEGLEQHRVVLLNRLLLEPLLMLFDDLGISKLSSQELYVPLWTIIGTKEGLKNSSKLTVTIDKDVSERLEMFLERKKLPELLKEQRLPLPYVNLRPYQIEGVQWLRLLQAYGLNGILADDMGLGKTIQAIIHLTQVHLTQVHVNKLHESNAATPPSLIICPTSLVENWADEFAKFSPAMRVQIITGLPEERKTLLQSLQAIDVIITSYSLLQKDIEWFEPIEFTYVLLDEAQQIKNKETRTARSVKRLRAAHRLVLTATPVENSIDDIKSLFEFLMPGYLRAGDELNQDKLKTKLGPFILRRMKTDVLADLPSITKTALSCTMAPEQQALYRRYADKASEEILQLVEKEGMEKAKIHVLATITRLKQICCHPKLANHPDIFSAKYELFTDLIHSLIQAKHKVVVFSQFTSMLSHIRDDFEAQGIRYAYLDGASKNRQASVREFNEDSAIPIFLVSLRAGGVGLNLVGADAVIHYDMWWNQAVESQATDRVWRLGQKRPVSCYKLITKGTIEERIVQIQEEKKELTLDILEKEEDILSKLKWDELLELLKL